VAHILRPISEPFSDDVAEAFKRVPQRNGYVIGLFRVFANSLRHLRKGFVNLLDKESPLPMREREIVILRISANNHCEYEWGVHVEAFGEYVGFSREQIDATVNGSHRAECWSERESLLIQAIDELCAIPTGYARSNADPAHPAEPLTADQWWNLEPGCRAFLPW